MQGSTLETGGYVGHATNIVGVRTDHLASTAFNDNPRRLNISGVREMNAPMFEMLELAETLAEAGRAFSCYMNAMFSVDAEQMERRAGRARFRSSFLRLIKGWGYDSNSPEGAVLKGWVESRFGIPPTFHKQPIRRISSGAWTTYVEEKMSSRFHANSIYAQLDLLYEFCQWALDRFAATGRTHLTLYRGVNALDEHETVRAIDRRTRLVRLNNLSSFSFDRDTAGCFGDMILTVSAPVAKIVFFNELLSAHPLKGEGEYLVIGGVYRVDARYF